MRLWCASIYVCSLLVLASAESPPPIEKQELFLKTAAIKSRKVLESGVTQSIRAVMSDGNLTHEAHIQFIDIYKPVFRGKSGTVEKNFRDTYKFNIAAFKLAQLLGLEDMVPVSVEREIDGKLASVTWWVDDVRMTEMERRDQKIKPPATQFWVDQLNKVRVFDQLIYNMDRNQGNLLITNDWHLWMIDHTRAFRVHKALLKPDALSRCDTKLLDNMRKLDLAALNRTLGPYLRHEEIAALLARRDAIVKFFESEIAAKGSDAVLTGMPRQTPHVTVP